MDTLKMDRRYHIYMENEQYLIDCHYKKAEV